MQDSGREDDVERIRVFGGGGFLGYARAMEFAPAGVAPPRRVDIGRVDVETDVLDLRQVVEDVRRAAPDVEHAIALARPHVFAHVDRAAPVRAHDAREDLVDGWLFQQQLHRPRMALLIVFVALDAASAGGETRLSCQEYRPSSRSTEPKPAFTS